ncbi:MAG: hypothetical protein GY788_12410 [bacterium]|nr:hypothetical protein [bacterium]
MDYAADTVLAGSHTMAYAISPAPQRTTACPALDRKIDAERFLTRTQAKLLDGSYVDPSDGQTSPGEYAGLPCGALRCTVRRPSPRSTRVCETTSSRRSGIPPVPKNSGQLQSGRTRSNSGSDLPQWKRR